MPLQRQKAIVTLIDYSIDTIHVPPVTPRGIVSMIIVLHINVTLFLRICVHVVRLPTMNLFQFPK